MAPPVDATYPTHLQIFGIDVQNGEDVAALPFGSPYDRDQFMAAVVARIKDAPDLEGQAALPKPPQALLLCTTAAPNVVLHLKTQYRNVAITANISVMQAPGVGVATLVMGFDQIDPDLLSLRPEAAGHANSIPPQTVSAVTFEDTCPTVSSVTFDDDIDLCRCPECRSGASASSRMQCFNPDTGEVDYYEESAHGNGSNDTPQSVASLLEIEKNQKISSILAAFYGIPFDPEELRLGTLSCHH